MDAESKSAWLTFVYAEASYREALAGLRHVDEVATLREGLGELPWRRAALVVLGFTDPAINEQLLPELFRLASVSHALIGEVRRCIYRIPRDRLVARLEPLVHGLIADNDSDYETYRRIAEMLRDLEAWPLLDVLTRAAGASPDGDIREVAEDFGGPSGGCH